jgi:hypothetical protein
MDAALIFLLETSKGNSFKNHLVPPPHVSLYLDSDCSQLVDCKILLACEYESGNVGIVRTEKLWEKRIYYCRFTSLLHVRSENVKGESTIITVCGKKGKGIVAIVWVTIDDATAENVHCIAKGYMEE